ncbi:hypothetical protein [Helicobacter sp. 11S02596-1]|uniref:hypothetical protein n=1 Tax=Helicobacter sp. 11S02596-1 TaxID=1476194 RepID=UPI0015DE61F6|nr:hypothetical protein [Helicobacter sp. 11S02596-1]
MKIASSLLLFAFLLFGCAPKTPPAKKNFNAIECKMMCEGDQCNQKCEEIQE